MKPGRNKEENGEESPKKRKVHNSRVKTGKKPGGQPGHKGATRPVIEVVEEENVIEYEVPQEILNDPNWVLTDRTVESDVYDIKCIVVCTKHVSPVYRNKESRKTWRAAFPEGVNNEMNYGNSAKAAAVLLRHHANVSIDKTREVISELTGGRIHPSHGWTTNVTREFAKKATVEEAAIRKEAMEEPYLHIDFTKGNLNGKQCTVGVAKGQKTVIYAYSPTGGDDAVTALGVRNYDGVTVQDCEAAIFKVGNGHQICIAHLFRDLKDVMENEPHNQWAPDMYKELCILTNDASKGIVLTEGEIEVIHKKYDEYIALGKKEYEDEPPREYFPYGLRLLKRMEKRKKDALFFLEHPEIPWHNNPAEAALRKVKRKFRQAIALRNEEHIRDYCCFMTVVQTALLRGTRPYETILRVLANGKSA